MSIAANDKVTLIVKYKIGGAIEKQLPGVNQKELMTGLEGFRTVEDRTTVNALLLQKINDPEAHVGEWINALTAPVLNVSEDVTCNSNFLEAFWQQPSPAKTVLCLLRSAVTAKKKVDTEKMDLEIIQALNASGDSTNVLTPPNTEDFALQVKAWEDNWNRRHGVKTSS